MGEIDAWLDRFRGFWTPKLEALATEVARGKKKRADDDKVAAERTRSTNKKVFQP